MLFARSEIEQCGNKPQFFHHILGFGRKWPILAGFQWALDEKIPEMAAFLKQPSHLHEK
jgi:hypothetical protein